MAIVKKKAAAEATAKAFIAGAPDAQKTIKRAGKKAIITVSIGPEMLAKVDAWAAERNMSRAAAISFAISNLN
ncbi:MAG: hypothetical protein A3F73_09345 [Gallionellales bacterium RIFCSPLOWO2_12_FULL_59_22]|nr:MAG: hypothetical protein A3H99_13120 [Gallionellales bacterium RIFCSPLOWO2_02_FULL_59_110]OGT14615.1 MAG: hypothetical protein A3F73_09345 [Gallionellales bacterium RIFCSPLOWO2_12_FULL_59_22]